MRNLLGFIIGTTILAGLFWLLETLWPEKRHQPHWRPDSRSDLIFWVFTAYITPIFANITLFLAIILTASFMPRLDNKVVGSQPVWLQLIELLLLGELLGYWSHRLFHTIPRLWRFHAVHHSPKNLDWLASARLHPVNEVISKLIVVIPLYLLGFSGGILTGYLPFLTFYPIFLHANVSWSYGPFRYLIASPAYHRWHHAADLAALNKNYSGLFPFMDAIFGTLYFPKNRQPQQYGLYQEEMPVGFWRQLAYPFQSPKTTII